jgi:hypothetical protein
MPQNSGGRRRCLRAEITQIPLRGPAGTGRGLFFSRRPVSTAHSKQEIAMRQSNPAFRPACLTRHATPAIRSVGGSASASRRYSAGPRVPPAFARPITAASPASAGRSPSLPLPTTWFGCPSWWGPRRSHARNLPRPGKNRQNQHTSLLKTRRTSIRGIYWCCTR